MDYFELTFKVTPKDPYSEILITELADLGFESFVEEEQGFKAYVPAEDYAEEKLASLPQFDKEATWEYAAQLIKDQNWNEKWEENFTPIEVEGICGVRATFHPERPDLEYDIVIQPKMAFGTGHHATTHMMMAKMLELDFQEKIVLDMGCGTSVLAILAAMKGAKEVMAIDIDEWAYENSLEHLELNKIGNVSVYQGDAQLFAGRLFNIILANINRNVLLQDLGNYYQSLQNQGDLLLSGFLEQDASLLMEEAKQLGLKFLAKEQKGNWFLLHFQK